MKGGHVDREVFADAAVEHRGRDGAAAELLLRFVQAEEDHALHAREAVAHVGEVVDPHRAGIMTSRRLVARAGFAISIALAAACDHDRAAASVVAPTSSPNVASSAAPPTAIDVRYVAIGDSFTEGTGSPKVDAFPVRVEARLAAKGVKVEVLNLGVNGFTTSDVIEVELPRLRAFSPSFATLAIGANDIVRGGSIDAYRENVRSIFDAIRAAGVASDHVVALPQPDWSASPVARDFGDPRALHEAIVRFNSALREEVEARGGRYLDLFPEMTEEAARGEIARDGLHPSARAYDAWAEAIAPTVPIDPRPDAR